VSRKQLKLIGLIGNRWVVFIDGVWVGKASKGRTVQFDVLPGRHKVKICYRGGKAGSNELELELAPGTNRSLTCEIDIEIWKNLFRGGLVARNRTQINFLRKFVSDGWITKDAIVLSEVPSLQRE
jgi:hypothetical protein